MEELFVYSLLYIIGEKCCNEYRAALDNLYLLNSSDDLLDLENRGNKDSMLHLYSCLENYSLNVELFGKCLMSKLIPIYEKTEIHSFGEKMYKLWKLLPSSICEIAPFHILSYADDCLAYGDEIQCRELYEKALCFYGCQGDGSVDNP